MASGGNFRTRGYYSSNINAPVYEGYRGGFFFSGPYNNLKLVFVTVANLVTSTKSFTRIRNASATAANLVTSTRTASHFRNALATVSNLVYEGKITAKHRYSTARMTVLTTNTKHATLIRVARVLVSNLANDIKLTLHKRLSIATNASLVSVKKNRSAAIKTTVINLAKSVKVSKFGRKSTITSVDLANLTKKASLLRSARVNRVNLVTALKHRVAIRTALANAVSLVRPKKGKQVNVKVTETGVIKVSKIARLLRRSTTLVANLVTLKRGRNVLKKASTIQVAAASVTRVRGAHKTARVTTTYEIGTTKGKTVVKKAIATMVGLLKYGVNRIMNVRSVESAQVQPINEINFFVTPNNVDVVGEFTSEDDQPGDFAEPVNNLGEDVVPT